LVSRSGIAQELTDLHYTKYKPSPDEHPNKPPNGPPLSPYLLSTIMTTTLLELSSIISKGVSEIASAYANASVPFVSLDDPTQPGVHPHPPTVEIAQASMLVIAAAGQLIAALQPPVLTIAHTLAVRTSIDIFSEGFK
jgi:hypothetical protein